MKDGHSHAQSQKKRAHFLLETIFGEPDLVAPLANFIEATPSLGE